MFRGGSYWKPPPMNPYTQGMPEELVDVRDLDIDVTLESNFKERTDDIEPSQRGKLTDSQRDRLEDLLRDLTPERSRVGEAMVWCLDHADAAEEVVECISEALSILQTPIPKKIARLFLVSDILFNSSAKVPNASFFRKHFQRKLPEIFRDVHETYDGIDGRLKAEQFKQKVMLCFRAWEDWAIYPNDYLINLQNIFLGLVPKHEEIKQIEKVELDGHPLTDPDLDGLPLDILAASRVVPDIPKALTRDEFDGIPIHDDFDGEPIGGEDSDVDGKPLEPPPAAKLGKTPEPALKFTKSKWETVDETELEAQAMTTSKWDLLGEGEEEIKNEPDEDLDGMPFNDEDLDGQEMSDDGEISEGSYGTPRNQPEMTEERRRKLREIEVKVMKYQDELEAGKRGRKPNMSMSEQVQHHRKKLLSKEFNDSPMRESRKRHRSGSPMMRYDEKLRYSDSPKRKRAKSPKKSRRSRSRSRSPHIRSRSRSPGRQRRKSKKSKHRD